jgi:predicted ATPase/DNA-binding SARP family transcriptional activator/DNA-binding CsgD family transcriptional regulator
MHREQLMDLLWPDSATRAASNNLRQVVYGARKVLDLSSHSSGRYLSLTDERLFLCPDGQLWVDVEAFEGAAATARRSRDPAAYRMALELYAGDILPEDRYEEWAVGRREGLRQLYLALLIELASLYEVRDEHASAIEALRKATEEDPTLEEAHASLMRLHALSGRPERALAQYARLHDALQKDMGTQPSEATRRVRDEIAAGRLPTAQPAGGIREEPADATKHNLSAPRTSFVGRELESVEIKRALAMTRLLTLTGAGGTGKTRLAIEVARDIIGSYPDGVWFVELAPLSEPGLVAQEVANVLGVQERPGEALADTLVDALAGKEMLLVIDNCEHLVEEAARLVDKLLAWSPPLKMLATSREPLGVSGEVLWAVPPLSLPGDTTNGGFTTETLVRYEAVRLFVDRARLRLLDFEVTRENAGAVARVCRKLDGIPLAIELATARIGALAVEQVAQRLESSLDFLKGTRRTAAPRQQTLRATLDWSYDLLAEPERAVFRRLSVFAGGWTLEAAEAVCSGDGIEEDGVLDLLGGLVDKSLVVARASTDGAVRYRMLEPVRQYGLERLAGSGETDEVRRRHAEFFLAFAEEAEPGLWGAEEATWLGRLEGEHDNLRAALSWSLEQGETEAALRLAGALWFFWDTRGYVSEGTRWLEEALGKDAPAAPTARARALIGLGSMLQYRSDFARAEACFEEALVQAEGLGDRARVVEALASLGWLAAHQGDTSRAKVLFEEGLAADREPESGRVLSMILNGLGWTASDAGDFGRAEALWKESLELERQSGSNMGVSGVLFNMGYTELARGNHEHATALLDESLAIGREIGDKGMMAAALLGLGIAATLRGEPSEAEAPLKESLAIGLELENRTDMAEVLEGLAEAAGALGQDLRAARLWGAAAALRKETGVNWASAERTLHEPQLSAARARLDEPAWEAAFAEGQAMTFEEAIEYALSEEQSDPSENPLHLVPPTELTTLNLTQREQEVALLVARGLTNRQVARELSISERTAANHVSKILRKLGLSSRAQIGALIVEDRPYASPQD